jgi:hypothetical protein
MATARVPGPTDPRDRNRITIEIRSGPACGTRVALTPRMSLLVLAPAALACVLFVETLRIRPGHKH